MKLKTSLALVLFGSALAILVQGCSPVGWATREVPDGSNLQPGESVTIFQHDGTIVTGEYSGSEMIPYEEYLRQYQPAIHSIPAEKELPSIGQSVQLITALSDTRFSTGQLIGFDLQNIWIKFPGNPDPEPIFFSSINRLSGANGRFIDRMMLRGMFLNGGIPSMSALKLNHGSEVVRVPLSSIRKLVAGGVNPSYTTTDGNPKLQAFPK